MQTEKKQRVETRRRIAEMEGGIVQGIPLEETLAKAQNHRPVKVVLHPRAVPLLVENGFVFSPT